MCDMRNKSKKTAAWALLAILLATQQAFAMDGGSVYRQTCATCHTMGSAGIAPKLGVRADWEPRLQAGRAKLLQSVMKGKGAMPPKGGNASLSDAQANAALDYMLMKVSGGQDLSRP